MIADNFEMSVSWSRKSFKSSPLTSQQPCNYDIFSLNRILTISTGSYASSSSDFIDTTQWEEITTQYSIDSDSVDNVGVQRDERNSVSGVSRVSSSQDMDFIPVNTPYSNKDDLFFNNVLKSTRDSRCTHLPQPSHAQSLINVNARNTSTSSLLAYTHGARSESGTNINENKAVTFRQVISAGHRGLYHVIAALCSNDVILLRFTGVVTGIDREDDSKRKRQESNDEDSIQSDRSIDSTGEDRHNESTENDDEEEGEEEDHNQSQLASPIVRCVNHFKEKGISVINMTLDETAKWLACITGEGDVHLVPVCKLFFPYNSENLWPFRRSDILSPDAIPSPTKKNKQNFVSLKDYTTYITDIDRADNKKSFLMTVKNIEPVLIADQQPLSPAMEQNNPQLRRQYKLNKHGRFTCCVWWRSFGQKDYLLIGTERGYIVILNMQSQIEEGIVGGFKHLIRNLEMVEDLQHKSYKYLLVHAASGQFYKLVLEQEDIEFHSYRTISDFCRMNTEKDAKLFEPSRIDALSKEYPCRVNVNRTNPKKGSLLTCFSRVNHQLSIYDPDNHRYPLYVFQLNRDSAMVHLTDQLLFSVQR